MPPRKSVGQRKRYKPRNKKQTALVKSSAQPVQVVKPKYSSKVPRNPFGPGRSMIMRMPYTDTITLSTDATHSAGSNYNSTIYALNSICLPRIVPAQAAGNYLPQGFNAIENKFYRYKVLGAKVKLTFSDPTKDLRVGCMFTASDDAQVFAGTYVSQMEMKLGTKFIDISAQGDRGRTFSTYVSIPRLDGIDKGQFHNALERYSGLVTSSVSTANTLENSGNVSVLPMKKPKFHLCVSDVDAGTAVESVNVKVDITYYVMLYGKMALTVSTSVA